MRGRDPVSGWTDTPAGQEQPSLSLHAPRIVQTVQSGSAGEEVAVARMSWETQVGLYWLQCFLLQPCALPSVCSVSRFHLSVVAGIWGGGISGTL